MDHKIDLFHSIETFNYLNNMSPTPTKGKFQQLSKNGESFLSL